jgi:hypothetical protein
MFFVIIESHRGYWRHWQETGNGKLEQKGDWRVIVVADSITGLFLGPRGTTTPRLQMAEV